ncbi:MAG: PfkB family carbohydrate kinase [Solirubrobacteraceae bacterium]
MSARHSVVCAGYMPLDIIHTQAGTAGRHAGGTAANVAAILTFLGWEAVLAGQTGGDVAGDELMADLRNTGVDTGQIHRSPTAETARLIHEVRHNGHSFAYRCPDCGSRFPRSRPLTLEQADACALAHPEPTVYFFDRANAATVALAERYVRAGSVVVFEPSVPANVDLLARAATVAHVIKHSDDRSVGGLDDLHIQPRAGQLRIVTHGAEGLALRVGSTRPRRLPALATLAVDTGGAGDWTTAGFLSKAVGTDGLDPARFEQAARFGQALAAVACATIGARTAMRLTRGSVLRRARNVLASGGLTSEPRLPKRAPLARPDGACATCLMPVAPALFDIASGGVSSPNIG